MASGTAASSIGESVKGLGVLFVIGWVFLHWPTAAKPNTALAAARTPDEIARAYFQKQGSEPIGRLRGETVEIVWNIDPYGGSGWLTKYAFGEQARDLIPLVLQRLAGVNTVELRAYGILTTVKGQKLQMPLVQMKMTRQESGTINWPGVQVMNVRLLSPSYHEHPALGGD